MRRAAAESTARLLVAQHVERSGRSAAILQHDDIKLMIAIRDALLDAARAGREERRIARVRHA